MGIYPQGTGYNTSTQTEKIVNPPFNADKSGIKFLDNFALPGGYNPVPIRVRDKSTDTVFMKNEEVTCPWVPRLQKALYPAWNDKVYADVMKFATVLEAAGFKCGDIFGKDCVDHNGV